MAFLLRLLGIGSPPPVAALALSEEERALQESIRRIEELVGEVISYMPKSRGALREVVRKGGAELYIDTVPKKFAIIVRAFSELGKVGNASSTINTAISKLNSRIFALRHEVEKTAHDCSLGRLVIQIEKLVENRSSELSEAFLTAFRGREIPEGVRNAVYGQVYAISKAKGLIEHDFFGWGEANVCRNPQVFLEALANVSSTSPVLRPFLAEASEMQACQKRTLGTALKSLFDGAIVSKTERNQVFGKVYCIAKAKGLVFHDHARWGEEHAFDDPAILMQSIDSILYSRD